MNTKTLDFQFDIKSLSDAGTFSGYGSVFNVKDSYNDIVIQGAFADSLSGYKSQGRMPAMLWQHRSAEPLGVYTAIEEDNIGLKLEGQIAMNTIRGAEAHALMKMGAISGLSIGYMVPAGGDVYDSKTGITTLKKLDLMEVSLVTFPANDAARIQGVKSIEAIEDLKSAEAYLRDSAGMTRSQALAFIARVKSLGQRDADEGEMQQILTALRGRNAVFASS